MHEIDSKKLEQCMISLFAGSTKEFRRTRYLSTNGMAIRDAILGSTKPSDEVIKLIDEVVLFNRLLNNHIKEDYKCKTIKTSFGELSFPLEKIKQINLIPLIMS